MGPGDRCQKLAERIVRIMEKGQTAGAGMCHYIDSTFGNPTKAELAAMVADDSNSETDPLLDLIFFPDEALQQEIEEVLEEEAAPGLDDADLAALLASRVLTVPVFFPDQQEPLRVTMPSGMAEVLVRRLRISRRIPSRLQDEIAANVPAVHRVACKVKLRNARFDFSEGSVAFLETFFAKVPAEQSGFWECLTFALGFLEEAGEAPDLYQALMRKKRILLRSLHQAEQYARKLQRSNMETLLQQGIRMPHIDIQAARRTVALIDRIGIQVFGFTDPDPGPAAVCQEWDPEDMEKIFDVFK